MPKYSRRRGSTKTILEINSHIKYGACGSSSAELLKDALIAINDLQRENEELVGKMNKIIKLARESG